MPLTITVPSSELYDEATSRFFYTPKTVLTLEHSLISLSKWESKWKKPYLWQRVLTDEANLKTKEEELDYIRCMTIEGKVDPNVYRVLSAKDKMQINDYVNDSMTATKITQLNPKPSREVVTNELIYYWMTVLNIPFQPCERWHLNHLIALIEVCAMKNESQQKMPKETALRRSHSINTARRAQYAKHRR